MLREGNINGGPTRLLADETGRVLWDGAGAREAGGGGPAAWREVAAADLPPPESTLWHALGGGPRLWLGAGALADGTWSRLVLRGEAPRSQFDVLRELGSAPPDAAADPLASPVACVAGVGRGFHGHRGRTWATLPGNLHLCVALRPALPAATCGLPLTVLPVVAAVDAIDRVTGGRLPVGIKWVNDLVVDGRKLAGLLASTQTLSGTLASTVLGLGINLARAPALSPSPFVPAAASLAEFPAARAVTLPELLRAGLDALAFRLRQLATDGPGPLLAAYRARSLVLGRRVRVYPEGLDEADPGAWPPPLAEGTVTAIADDLSLRLRRRTAPIDRGRLVLLPSGADPAPQADKSNP